MAKRRNLKKEKALRNQAYARKFRKRPSNSRFGRRRFGNDNRAEDSDMEQTEGAADQDTEGAAS
jgi:hypothetical protein